MSYHVFDLSLVGPEEVREFLTVMANSGLVGGIYLWINKSTWQNVCRLFDHRRRTPVPCSVLPLA